MKVKAKITKINGVESVLVKRVQTHVVFKFYDAGTDTADTWVTAFDGNVSEKTNDQLLKMLKKQYSGWTILRIVSLDVKVKAYAVPVESLLDVTNEIPLDMIESDN